MINVFYTHLVDGPEIVEHQEVAKGKHEIDAIIDNYPWVSEIELSAQHDEGGSFFFLLGDENGLHASYQFVPVEMHKGFLFLNIIAKKGFLGIFGSQSVNIDFDVVSAAEAKTKVYELLNYSIDELYEKYKNHST